MTGSPKITQQMIDLYDEYTHITLDRRAYMGKLTALVGSVTAAVAVTSLIEARKASAEIVKADDARVRAERVTYPGEGGEMAGYLCRPANAAGKLPAVPAYRGALDKAGIKYDLFIYEGTQHAFNNDTSAARYNKAAADLAWSRTIALFKEALA